MKKISSKTKKNILVIAVSLLLVAVIGIFASFFANEDLGKVKDKIDNFIEQEEVVENHNLLYNSDFSINTTGNIKVTGETHSSTGSVIIDGWEKNNDFEIDYTAAQAQNGLYVKVNETEGSTHSLDLKQKVSAGFDNVFGQTLTVTMSIDGIVYSDTFEFNEIGYWYAFANGTLAYSMIHTAGSNVSFIICAKPNFDGVINWVQLELGDVFTGYTQGPAVYVDPTLAV